MNQKEILKLIAMGGLSATLMTGCGKDDYRSHWKKSNGTQGLINMRAVKDAFNKRKEAKEFEKRLNEIFEGDNLVLIKSDKVEGGFKLEAFEDLDNNKEIDSNKDDLLFVLTVKNGLCTLKGMGKNSYFEESWPYNERSEKRHYSNHGSHSHFYYWYYTRRWGGYYTPASSYNSLYAWRNSYRGSSRFRTQISRNNSFASDMQTSHGSKYTNTKESSVRQSHINSSYNSAGFNDKLAAAKSKSSWGRSYTSSRSSFGSSSGFRGSSGASI